MVFCVAVLVQLCAGFVNIALSAPGWMQIVHLFLGQVVWLSWVWWVVDDCASVGADVAGAGGPVGEVA